MTTIDTGKVEHARLTRMNLKALNSFLNETYSTVTLLEHAVSGRTIDHTLEAQANLRKSLLARLRTAQTELGNLVRQVESMPVASVPASHFFRPLADDELRCGYAGLNNLTGTYHCRLPLEAHQRPAGG